MCGLILLSAISCTDPPRLPFSVEPSEFTRSKTICVALMKTQNTNFDYRMLHRLVWKWNESCPGFSQQLRGTVEISPKTEYVSEILEAIGPQLRAGTELLICLRPRRYVWTGRGDDTHPHIDQSRSGGPLIDEAEFGALLIDTQTGEILSESWPSVEIKEFRTVDWVTGDQGYQEPILEQLACKIAVRLGLGWERKYWD